MNRRYVMIGSGPAAISAAETIRAQDPGGEIVIVGAEPYGYYSRPGLAYYVAGEVPEDRLFPFRPEDFARLNTRLILKRATGIDAAGHRVTLEDGRILPYDRLLLATGARAIPVQIPGAELEGVVKLDDLEDARGLIQRSRRAKVAVVVGGGITALEIVEGLRARRVHVHYFMRRDRYWSNVLSEEESRLVERGLRSRGVQIHYSTELAKIVGRQGHVAAVVTGNGEEIPADVQDCYSCHAEPSFHTGAFGAESTQCATCHTTTAWTPAQYTLTHTAIPTDHGAEEQVPGCKTCHPTNVSTYTCYGCHEHTESRIRADHEGRPVTELMDCIRCHPGGREGD